MFCSIVLQAEIGVKDKDVGFRAGWVRTERDSDCPSVLPVPRILRPLSQSQSRIIIVVILGRDHRPKAEDQRAKESSNQRRYIRFPARNDTSKCVHILMEITESLDERESRWTSNEAVHNRQARDRRIISPARSALTPCFNRPNPHVFVAPALHSNLAPGPPGIRIHSVRC